VIDWGPVDVDVFATPPPLRLPFLISFSPIPKVRFQVIKEEAEFVMKGEWGVG